MAQHDYVIANGTGAAVRSDLNGGLAAIVSNNSGATEPGTMYAYQWWPDTTTGLLKIRNAANNAWVTVGTLASANLGLLPLAGGTMTGALAVTAGTAALPGIAVSGDLNTGIYSPGADQLAISTGGTERVFVSSVGLVGIGTSSPGNKLDVTVATNDPTTGSPAAGSFVHVNGNTTTVGNGPSFSLANASGAKETFWRMSAVTTSGNNGDLVFNGYNGGATYPERLRITAAGKVGIGTTSPAVTLDVSATDAIRVAAGTTGQRPTGAAGMLRYNSSLSQFEGYGTAWGTIGGGITSGTAVASTSGTSIDFTSIPSYVKRITVMFDGVSTSGTSNYQVQLGAGSITSSGYLSGNTIVNSFGSNLVTATSGIIVFATTAGADACTGSLTLSLISSNTWIGAGNAYRTNTAATVQMAGSLALGGTLDRVRITTVNGTDAFDAGSINILYEG